MVAPIHAAQRRVAKAAGERFYDTGEPCKRGHLSKRYTGTGLCAQCATEATLRVQAKKRWHPNRVAAHETNQTHYSTGTPCKEGHDRRFVSNGACADCAPLWTKKYKDARPGLEAKWTRERRAKDPSGHRAEAKRWYGKNLQRAYDAMKRWQLKNGQKMREYALTRFHRKRANGGSFTTEDIVRLRTKQSGCCAACGDSGRLEIDHIMPIALGGSSYPHNIQLLCVPCNRSKGPKHPREWKGRG